MYCSIYVSFFSSTMFLGICFFNLALFLLCCTAVRANFPLSGPNTLLAKSCYDHLSKNSGQDKCLSASEAKWNVSVTVNATKDEYKLAQCNAWTSSLQCIDGLICALCSKKEIQDIYSWELSAYENQTFCQLAMKPLIDWCMKTTETNTSSSLKSSSSIVITIVAILLLTLLILGGIAIILMINAPDKEDSKSDNEQLSNQKGIQSDFNFVSFLDSEKSLPKEVPSSKSKPKKKLLGKFKLDNFKIGQSSKNAKH